MIRRDRNSRRRAGGTMEVVFAALALLLLLADPASAQGVPATCPAALGTAQIIRHDFTVSFCELCDVGTVRIVVENPFRRQDDVDFSDLVVTEDLGASGLTYVPGSTTFSGNNIVVPPDMDPLVGGPAGSVLTWNFGPAFEMLGRLGNGGNNARLIIEFEVRRHPSVGDEGLVQADRTIEASVELTPSCAPAARFTDTTGPGTLPLREPVPRIIKRGRNVDAGQGSGSYTATVYGHAGDDVIWRVEVRNTGLAPLQDFKFSDSVAPNNFEIDYVCDTEARATAAANGSPPASCLPVGGTTNIADLDVAAVFGGGANPYIVAPAGGSGFYYLVGRVTDSCVNGTNTVFDVEWGCQSEPPVGGISATSNGIVAGDSAALSTRSLENGLAVNVSLTGVNTSQPMGARGTVTIRIRNNTGGTIKDGDTGIRLRDLLPPQYVIDPTFAPTITTAPAYGNAYPGMVDRVTWTNPAPGTFPLVTNDPSLPLSNTDLQFLLTSSTVNPEFPDQFNMIRHGDVVTIRFRTVLIDPQYYDRVANLDVRVEEPNSVPPGTDPTASFPISNHTEIWFEEFCTPNEHHLQFDQNSVARPEDLDVDVVGNELVFILTNTGDPLPLTVALTNRGGHDATDYVVYVTFGEAMVVQTAPAGCSPTANPPAFPVWQDPVALPATASVYACNRGTMSPGETELLNFEVVKNTAPSFDDDLTFRADVIGEIRLNNGTPLWFPTPVARPDGITDRANNYSIDALWARVIGYNLFKTQLGVCSENNPPPGVPDDQVQIGEQCSFHVESGGWFGFKTPGFTYIAVQNIQVVDQIPDGQGYISSTDPLVTSTPAIKGVSLNPPPQPLEDTPFDWTFNTVVPAERITEKDHWFRVDVTTRLLNDPIDASAAPNQHAAISTNVMTSTFDAVFFNESTNQEELYGLGPNTVGFPREVHRRVDLTVTEPHLTVTKEVCNETIYGAGPACSNFVPLADDGDAFDSYIYRVTVANEATSAGVTRAPAYDVTVTTVTDPSDQLFVQPLDTDTVDNDGDASVDGADAGGEGVIGDNTLQNGVPAQIIESYTHSTALERIDAGQNVVFYYRVDPDDRVAPQQALTNSATASYDSLEGASGSQTAPLGANGEIGGARQYVSAPGTATIQIIPVEVPPKQITRVSNSSLAVAPAMQEVSIGEEVEYELRALIPVAQLRSFVIRDELPTGLTCADAPVVDLSAPPYAAAGFVPGGVFRPTCDDTEVVWDFGNQTVTRSPRTDRRFDFGVTFVGRVGNLAANQENTVIHNGGAFTVATVSYVDEGGNAVVLPIDEAAVVVREPVIELTKTFSAPQADAADLPLVTVTATNTGTATAYNLRVLDDLSGTGLSFAGSVTGADPPTADVAIFGPDRPLFRWAPGFAIAPGETVSFSFEVRLDDRVQPLEVLGNTIQADWTSLPGRGTALNPIGEIGPDGSPTGMRNGSLPVVPGDVNDYEAEASATIAVPPLTFAKTDLDVALAPEIGVHKSFEIVISLPEGESRNVVVNDDLAAGAVSYVLEDNATFDVTYQFDGIATINGQAPGEAAFTSVPADQTSGVATWSIGTVVTQVEDDFTTSAISPAIHIRYSARVNNDLATNTGSTLQNSALLDYTNGETGAPEQLAAATAPIAAIEPSLTATKVLTNVTAGKAPADPPAFGDILQYVVTIVNGGNATAYDVNVVDTLPPELALSPSFVPTATIDGAAVPGFVGVPAGAPDGPLIWGRENDDDSLDIPQSGFLELTYRVVVRTPPLDPTLIENNVWIDWTSLDAESIYERTGNGCPIVTPPDDYCFGPAAAQGTVEPIPPPDALLKENTQATAAVGEAFRYRITVPATPYPFALHDVQIRDDLTASAADLRFIGVTKIQGSEPWTPVNTGTPTNLVIEDPAIGIDIPANEQIVVEITVVLEDTATNVSGLPFTNTATYLYNWVDGDASSQRPGFPGTTQPMTIVGPDTVTLEKSGPPGMTVGTPATFTLDVHNTGTGPAWNLTITDQLPDGATGGTCDAAPSQVTAQVFQNDRSTPVSAPLTEGTDFTVVFSGAPTCEMTISMLSAAAVVGADERLIVSYQTVLDADTQDAAVLINVAGATEWFSADGSDPATAADRRTYSRVLTDGTVGVLDHEDAHTLTVALPSYLFEKTVMDVNSGADPAAVATPGDRLHYRLRVENTGDVPLDGFTISDELDELNAPAAFQAGTLTLVTVPAGADTSNTSAVGGAAGTGVLDVRNLSLPNLGDSLVIEFEIDLAPVLPNGTAVTNQAQLIVGGVPFALSDDPNVGPPADPFVAGDEDPTRLVIQSAPVFQVLKVSADLTGDPAVLLAGETLRYTITVKNVGTADAVDATLRDQVPVNTSYVPGSTRLNGAPVADGAGGVAPLSVGIPIHPVGDPTPGSMPADAAPTANNGATLTFDVVVDADAVDGTVISNQAFVSAVQGGVVDQPSDDPRTAVPDDPTRNVVGDVPLLFATKSVAIGVDGGSPGIVDPGDVLHYTITVYNSGGVPATAASLADAVPANTTYVADTLTLNGLPVGRPDAGVFPLVAGIAISSSDLTPPVPAPGAGTLSPGQSAVVAYDLLVDAAVAPGTIISNQAVVRSDQVPRLLTDGDGNPATGPEPTVVVVGDGQQLSITKQVAVVGGGDALPGSQLEYIVRVVNIAAVPAYSVVITDDLDVPVAGQLTWVAGSATMNGSPNGVSVVGSLITADYSGLNGPLQPGQAIVLRFLADLDANIALGTTVTNTGVVTWNDPPQTANASVSFQVGGMPGVGALNGRLWHDVDLDGTLDAGEPLLEGWTVKLLRNGQSLQTVTTDANGSYRITGLAPNDQGGITYALRFKAPGARARTASLGRAQSPFTNGPQEISDIVVASGSNLQDLDLPIQPNGVVYDAVQRAPLAGARLTLLGSGGNNALPPACFDDPAQQGQVTLGSGFYKFDLNFSDPACPSGGSYVISAAPPGSSYARGESELIPPGSSASTAAFSVPACPTSPDDAVPATAQFCEAQASPFAPPSSVGPRGSGTRYYLNLALDGTQSPGSSQIFNNHIPVDPVLDGAIAITKTSPLVNVSVGQLVPYEITLHNELAVAFDDLGIVDTYPNGFRYVEKSATIDGVQVEPKVKGQQLIWRNVGIAASGDRSVKLLLAVGAGATEGEYVNRAQAISSLTRGALSGVASATVRVVPDPTFACTDVIGKVFDDANGDGEQDRGEHGLQGVKLVTARGLVATTDEYGRFHITCAVVPREGRGSNFILKLDDRSLPTGYRMTTRQVQVKRATRGKALVFDYGASIRRVVSMDMADAVFEPGSTQMRAQWKPRIGLLLEELAKAPSVLRLSYIGDVEDEGLVNRRLDAVKREIEDHWKEEDRYELTIETEVFWRRGAPLDTPAVSWQDDDIPGLPSVSAGPPVVEAKPGEAVERHLPADPPPTQWTQDPERLATQAGDRVEQRKVLAEEARTVKLRNVVPPIHFESGVANIPPSTVDLLRNVLDDMRHLENVRLHLIGHTDDQPLSDALARVYGDNEGLSRERAGEVAEFLKTALALPPEAVSFEWAGASQPVASNATAAGRASNRRVEVEVWYDETRQTETVEDVVVPEEIKRVKICRMETVCKLRYLEGHEHRARVKNLVAPLHLGEENAEVPDEFVRQIGQALHDLRDRLNVTVKFVGFTDDAPLTGRTERIYGTHLALSKAWARRVALGVQEALHLPSTAVASDGRGAQRPIASNDTDKGRALNRRVEVEFWYDDPLQELPDEPQLCPDAAGAETVTKVYDPPWGRIASLPVDDGQIPVPEGYADTLRRALSDVADKANVRLRFVGYTGNERLERRTALVYGDDIGLSTARARRAMKSVQAELGLDDSQVEHEGRGYVQSADVVNAGFVQGDRSYVDVEVVYDELALVDDNEGVEITPITRELEPRDPLDLNLMRISVDGVPIDDPGRSSADIQRCTDVALERADIQFRFDDLSSAARLGVTVRPATVAVRKASDGSLSAQEVRFRTYTNYAGFIERSEVRVFEASQSLQAEPLAVVAVGQDGLATWQPDPKRFPAPVRALKFVLRAYGAEGRFDETAPQQLWMVYGDETVPGSVADASVLGPEGAAAGAEEPARGDGLLAGYGESEPTTRNIPLDGAGTVRVQGRDIPPGHEVWVAGEPVPVDENGRFVAETLLPSGTHTVEVAVLDAQGNGELFLRDLEIKKSDWFYVGIADLTLTPTAASGNQKDLQGNKPLYDEDSWADGRLAFYVNGRFGDDWKLTASADTREDKVTDLFSNFLDKSPDSLFRRIDPDYHYPTFGDDGTVEETAPTSGKLYVKLSKDQSQALWGNFDVRYLDNELAQVDRGLYGGNLHYQTLAATSQGEQRVELDGFAAQPGTVSSWEELRGTGGSLYYLRRQDILTGSERVRIEIRDKDTGLVTGVVNLQPKVDYDIDYLQGRILLSEPLAATVDDHLLVRSQGLSGDEAWLVVQYEYTPSFDQLDALTFGGQGRVWLNDYVGVGLTASRNDEGANSTLYGGDVTFRKGADTWLKLQAGRSDGLVSSAFASDDGGFNFLGTVGTGFEQVQADAYRVDGSLGFGDLFSGLRGRLSLYAQRTEAGYSAPGQLTLFDTDQYGGTFDMPVTDDLHLVAKADRSVEKDGLETTTGEADVAYQLTDGWSLSSGVRYDRRKDSSAVVAATQEEGDRTDGVVEIAFDTQDRWRAYAFGQATVMKTGDREANNRGGVGGAYRLTDRLSFDGEVSGGNLGPALTFGTSYQETENTRRYLTYTLEDERAATGVSGQHGTLVSGVRSRFSDSGSVFVEDRYEHSDFANGLSRSVGISLAPAEHWTLGANWELGNLFDRQTNAETKRRSGGGTLAYGDDRLQISSGIEYRHDETEQTDGAWNDRTTWLFRNNAKYQLTPSTRLLGKFDHSFSDSSLGQFYDGGFTDAVFGLAFRPVEHDKLDVLAKYTYFYNVPTTDQVVLENTPVEFLQKSHIASLDVTYQLTSSLSIGGKYAYRRGEVSLEREHPDFFRNDAHLFVLRTDWRFTKNWEGSVEGRMLDLPDLNDRRAGALVTLYRYLGKNFKVGVGYNFTDFSDDLTDLSYDHHGVFFNFVGSL